LHFVFATFERREYDYQSILWQTRHSNNFEFLKKVFSHDDLSNNQALVSRLLPLTPTAPHSTWFAQLYRPRQVPKHNSRTSHPTTFNCQLHLKYIAEKIKFSSVLCDPFAPGTAAHSKKWSDKKKILHFRIFYE
jgi:hypothetical protein